LSVVIECGNTSTSPTQSTSDAEEILSVTCLDSPLDQ